MLFFVNFLTLRMANNPKIHASSVSWFPVKPITILRKANLIFQGISLSNARLLSKNFFASGVPKLNYIKNGFF